MKKFAIITDLHFGARNANEHFANYFNRFFDEVFFPYCFKNDIREVLCLGDVMDVRKYTDHKILSDFRKHVEAPLRQYSMKMTVIPGNHDTYYKETNTINALDLFLADRIASPFILVTEPSVCEIAGHEIGLIPWMAKDNQDACVKFITDKATKVPVIAGHFDINDFIMDGTMKCEHGLDAALFTGCPQVWSGHFHGKQSKGNIHYLGTACEHTFTDADVTKGFHTFDGKTLAFIPNPITMHHVIVWDGKKTYDVEKYRGKIVKMSVEEKPNVLEYDTFVDAMNKTCHKFVVQDFSFNTKNAAANDIKTDSADTKSFIREYVEKAGIAADKVKPVQDFMMELYTTAMLKREQTF